MKPELTAWTVLGKVFGLSIIAMYYAIAWINICKNPHEIWRKIFKYFRIVIFTVAIIYWFASCWIVS